MSDSRLIRETEHTSVVSLDRPGQVNACHQYEVVTSPQVNKDFFNRFAVVNFQNGPINDFGVNGCQNEDLCRLSLTACAGSSLAPFHAARMPLP